MSFTAPQKQHSFLQKSSSLHVSISDGIFGLFQSKQTGRFNILASLWQWTILIVSLIGGSCVGIFYFYIQIDCQLLKSSWRLLAITISMLPFVCWEYSKHKDTYQYSKENLLNVKSWKTMFWAALGHSIWTVATLISVNYTSVAQSFLFLNLHSIIIVVYNLLRGKLVSSFEIAGALLATGGTAFLAFDGDFESKEGMVDLSQVTFWERLIFGDVVGIIGSIGAAFYFSKNHDLKYDFPVYLGITCMSIIGFLQISISSFILEGSTFSFNPVNGLFGLFSQEWFVIYIYIVIITGYLGYVAYIMALKYFDALLVSLVITLEPVVGAFLVFLLGWQSFPGILTIIGFAFIVPGIVVVTFGNAQRAKKNSIEASKAKIQVPLLNIS